jgi:O-acetyl-ADP-ribose deacetylase (regulator of RNase III)
MDEAAPIALQTVIDYLSNEGQGSVECVRFVLYGWEAYQVYQRTLKELLPRDTV